jgi:hypothetical protein
LVCFVLCGCRDRLAAAVVQRFIGFSADPQVMQQHCQLARRGNDGSLLAAPPATLGQFQAPAPEITVHRLGFGLTKCRAADVSEQKPPSQWNETSRGRDYEGDCRSWRVAVCPSDAAGDNSDTLLILTTPISELNRQGRGLKNFSIVEIDCTNVQVDVSPKKLRSCDGHSFDHYSSGR